MAWGRALAIFAIWFACSVLAVAAAVETPGLNPAPAPSAATNLLLITASSASMLIGFTTIAVSFFLLKEVV
ncbi:hypothetical protein HS088_TW06G01034 [Tripterygium wilfordii]|uniref:Transmembrane protein n=1 Tax=Tripterygium wilfordii TaxID=458696 RepID=A0A7J7DKM2_TRIWF|nr:hypothetical protein HS088_TW06G01034 [Tripterygium wilfordii]